MDDFSLSIRRGEVFGLLGPNGAGKTTLIRLLIGLIKPTSGTARISYNGAGPYDIRKDIMEIRKKASLLPQEAEVYENLTAKENIMYYGQIYGNMSDKQVMERTEELIDMIGLRGRENDVTKELSGGMKRKVLVARALVMDPDLIFLDEPTTGIDILGARTVRNLIKRLSKEMQKTIILTTHDLAEVEELCDRVGILVKGKLTAVGSPDELEEKFQKAGIEDVFIGLTTGEGVLEEEQLFPKKKPSLISRLLKRS
ncbi:MAG: ABC transporter ATP-binding protein [Candidatus Heimdallarchaeota archaeon]|nr:MAG: ABC transporter ATP-binding protein [Candidatus Heimdallarchaeota archaeon]